MPPYVGVCNAMCHWYVYVMLLGGVGGYVRYVLPFAMFAGAKLPANRKSPRDVPISTGYLESMSNTYREYLPDGSEM